MSTALGNERQQLLGHWTKLLQRHNDWISFELRQVQHVLAASKGDRNAQESLGSYLRQFHDKLGFKAKGTVRDGGLCVGAIFRTQAFIVCDERVGSKVGQSVHIEHTFPIRQLRIEIGKRPFQNYPETLSWLLTHSVATAFHEREKLHLAGWSSSSDALNPDSRSYLKPFGRYEALHTAEGVVWNVFDGCQVDPKTFTFRDHFQIMLRLLEEAGAARTMLAALHEEQQYP